jgi:hypothetical protein
VGTDPWAEDRWDSEPDLADVPLPISLSNCCPTASQLAKCSIPIPALAGILSHVGQNSMEKLGNRICFPRPEYFSYAVELIIHCQIRVGNFSTKASVLIDTGCRIPMLFRTGLIPQEYLERAQKTIAIVTADGTPMAGGTHGCKLEVVLPISGQRMARRPKP